MRKALKLGLILPLAGCVSTSDVTPMGRDTYMVGTSSQMLVVSPAEMTAKSARKANEFCASMGKEMLPLSSQNGGLYEITDTTNTFMFRCLAKNDPGNERPDIHPVTNGVVDMHR